MYLMLEQRCHLLDTTEKADPVVCDSHLLYISVLQVKALCRLR